MNRHYLPYLLLSFIITNPSKAQQTKTALLQGTKCIPYYSRLLDASKDDYVLCADFKTNGTGVISGYTTSHANGSSDAFIAAIDSKGNAVWSKMFGGAGAEQINKIKSTTDGGFIAVGSTASYGSNTAAWLVKFDVGGNILWSRTYDDANIYGIAGNNIIQTTDGGYAFSGTYSNQPGIADAMVVKTDSLGKPQWAKRFNSGSTDVSWGLIQSGNNLLVTAFEYGQSASYYDGIIMKLSLRKGELTWSHRFDIDNRSNNFSDIMKTAAGFAVYSLDVDDFAGGNAATTIINVDGNGNPQSFVKVTLDNPYNLGHGQNTLTADGGHLITQYGLGTQNDLYIFKTTNAGGLQWIKKVSGTGMRACTSVKQMPDGGYAMAGFSNNNAYGSADSMNAMLLRTDSNGNIPACAFGTDYGHTASPSYYSDTAFKWAETGDLVFPAIPVTVHSADFIFGNKRICYSCTTSPVTNTVSMADAVSSEATALFAVYPNPVKDKISFLLKGINATNGSINISDMYGRVVLKEKLTGAMPQFPTTQLTAGIYSATLVTLAGQRFTTKFLKE